MEADNYVIVQTNNGDQTFFLPEYIFKDKFYTDFHGGNCYFKSDCRHNNYDLELDWYQFIGDYSSLPKGILNIKVVGNYDCDRTIEY